MPTSTPSGTAKGIARSLRIYHRDLARTRRMDALNTRFCRAGGLVFDIGAHVGDRVASFRRLGARVVAIEPQPAAMRVLRLMFGRDPGATLLPMAIGAVQGTIRLQINTRNPTVSSASAAFIAAAEHAPGWTQERWDSVIEVPALTMDDLVARHGLPDFVKIDVEGFEAEAIAGLSQPLPALSFEFTTMQPDIAQDAIARLAGLGDYVFNLSIGETHVLELADWAPAADLAAVLHDLPAELNSGDIYARRA